MNQPLLPKLLSVRELADRLSLSTKTVRRMIDAGELPVHRIGGQIRISEIDAARFVAAGRQKNARRALPHGHEFPRNSKVQL